MTNQQADYGEQPTGGVGSPVLFLIACFYPLVTNNSLLDNIAWARKYL